MNDQFNYQDNKLSYSVIVSSSQGKPDKKGEKIAFPDEDIKQRVREKLIKEITQKYDITRLPKY